MKSETSSTKDSVNESLSINENVFVLRVWPGEWDLPSLDPECLTVMCFLKYAQVEHQIKVVDKAWDLFKNPLPSLTYKNKNYDGIDQIIDCIKQHKNVDLMLNEKNYPDMIALLCLFKQKFIPAFNSLCWLDEENTYNVTRRAYGKHLRFPLSVYRLKRYADDIRNSILSQYRSSHIQYENIKQHIIYESKECLNILSQKLDQNLFIFENKPTLLDAYLFGYLSILSKAPFVNSPLKSHLVACSNLCSLISRIQRENFPVDKKELEKKRAEQMASQMKFINWFKFFSFNQWFKKPNSFKDDGTTSKLVENEEWEKRKQQIIALSVAISAMLVYAFAIGLIKIDIIKTDLEYIEKS